MIISISAQQISGAQIKEARKLLGWTQQKLAEMTDVSLLTVKRLEAGKAGKESINKTARLLRSVGIEFVREDGVTVVKLKRPEPATANWTAAADAQRKPVYSRRRGKGNPDLGYLTRRRVRDEAQTLINKIQLCYKMGKIDRQSAERMLHCALRVQAVAKWLNTNILLTQDTLPSGQEQLFLADLVELRSSVNFLNRLLVHK
jgi:transcriptional regulator with XRE-family HTH domain